MGTTTSTYRNEGLQMLKALKKSSETPDKSGFFGFINTDCDLHLISTESDPIPVSMSTDQLQALSPQMIKPNEVFEDTMQIVRSMAKTEIGDGFDEKVFDQYFPAFYRIAQKALIESIPLNRYNEAASSNIAQELQLNNENEHELLSADSEIANTELANNRSRETSKPQCLDGYRWRKYGEKKTRTTGFVRSYYKCVEKGCYARKILQMKDGVMYHSLTKYFSLPHTHPTNICRAPAQRKRGKRIDHFSSVQSTKRSITVKQNPTEMYFSSSPDETPDSISSSSNIDLNSQPEIDAHYDNGLYEMELFI